MGIALPALALVAVTMSTRRRILPSLRRLRGLPPSTDLAGVVLNLLHLIELQIEVPEGPYPSLVVSRTTLSLGQLSIFDPDGSALLIPGIRVSTATWP